MWKPLVVTIFFVSFATQSYAIKLHFYELKPYIYYENNRWEGIFADFMTDFGQQENCLFEFASADPMAIEKKLGNYQINDRVNLTIQYRNRSDFIAHNLEYVRSGQHRNETTLWFPLLGNELAPMDGDLDIAIDEEIATIVLSESLDFSARLERTFVRIKGLLLVTGLIIVAAAIVLRILVSLFICLNKFDIKYFEYSLTIVQVNKLAFGLKLEYWRGKLCEKKPRK